MTKINDGARRQRKRIRVSLLFMTLFVLGLSALWVTYPEKEISHRLINTLGLIVAATLMLRRIPHWWRRYRYRRLKIHHIDAMQGHEFEHYIAALLEHRGFKTRVTRASGDLGVDIIAQRKRIRYAIQCKRYSKNIPRHAVSDVVAGKYHYHCTHAMVITNRYFTQGAITLAQSTQCELVDRDTLIQWILAFHNSR